MKVHTTKGLIDIDELEVGDFVRYTETSREIATVWFLKGTGECVRRDGWVSMLRTPEENEIKVAQESFPGGPVQEISPTE